MTVAREDIMIALCTLVFGIADFKTTGRRVLLWSKVAEQPACFVRNTGDLYDYAGIQNAKRIMEVEVWLYSKAGQNPDAVPGIALNNMADALDVALAPSDMITGRQTLGGLVQHCWIEGHSEFDPGDLDGQAKAVIPIRILVP
jgi:hypothetical protein